MSFFREDLSYTGIPSGVRELTPTLALEPLWGAHRGWVLFLNPQKGVSLGLSLGSCEAALSPQAQE